MDELDQMSKNDHSLDDEDEIQNYFKICEKNLLSLEEQKKKICEKCTIKGNPVETVSNIKNKLEDAKNAKDKASLDILTTEARVKVNHKKIEKLKEEVEFMNEQLELCMKNAEELKICKKEVEKNLQNKHNAYKQAIYYYKYYLEMYVDIDEQDDESIKYSVYFFTTNGHDKSNCVSMRCNKASKVWTLLDVRPQLPEEQFAALRDRFHQTNNVAALLYHTRAILTRRRQRQQQQQHQQQQHQQHQQQ